MGIRRVLVHGLPYFGRLFAQLMGGEGWQFRFYPDQGPGNFAALALELGRCDIVYQIGGRVTVGKFLRAAKLLNKGKIVMHWAGSDVLDERGVVARGKRDPWVAQKIHHWAESDWMVNEVNELGVPCERVALPSSLIPDRSVPLPVEFRVLVHVPSVDVGYLYGLDRILQVARNVPQVPFELVGWKAGQISSAPHNLQVHKRIRNLEELYKRSSVVWRPVRHDGLSFMVREALGYGRHVLYTYPFIGCVQVNGVDDAQKEILRVFDLHRQGRLEINYVGQQAVSKNYACGLLKQEILSRLEALP